MRHQQQPQQRVRRGEQPARAPGRTAGRRPRRHRRPATSGASERTRGTPVRKPLVGEPPRRTSTSTPRNDQQPRPSRSDGVAATQAGRSPRRRRAGTSVRSDPARRGASHPVDDPVPDRSPARPAIHVRRGRSAAVGAARSGAPRPTRPRRRGVPPRPAYASGQRQVGRSDAPRHARCLPQLGAVARIIRVFTVPVRDVAATGPASRVVRPSRTVGLHDGPQLRGQPGAGRRPTSPYWTASRHVLLGRRLDHAGPNVRQLDVGRRPAAQRVDEPADADAPDPRGDLAVAGPTARAPPDAIVHDHVYVVMHCLAGLACHAKRYVTTFTWSRSGGGGLWVGGYQRRAVAGSSRTRAMSARNIEPSWPSTIRWSKESASCVTCRTAS